MTGRLDGRIALVFGAGSSGPGWSNGKATALTYAREGAVVVCVDRVEDAAAETATTIETEGFAGISMAGDVTDPSTVEEIRREAVHRFGRIDVLHNNVGIATVGDPTQVAPEDWERTLRINLTGAYNTCRAVLPTMVEGGGGAIVNVGSIASARFIGFGYSAYTASKAGLEALTRDVAISFADRGIRANCLLPGLMDTPMVRGQLGKAYGDDEAAMIARRHAQVPMGRMGDAWDVANAALFLACDESRYITGQSLVVDGGLSLTVRGA